MRIETEYVLDRWRAAGKQSVGKIEQPARLLIAQDNPEVVVEEGNAAREVVDDGLQLGCALAQQAIVLLEQGIELLPLGNVFVRDHMAAVRRLAAPHIDDASVSKLVDARGCLVEFFDQIVDEMFGAGRIVAAARHAILEQLAERGSRFYLFAGEAVHLSIAIVADHQLLLAIEHGQALRHVVQGRVELLVLLLQPLLEALALGDVLVRRHPAAAAHGLAAYGDVAAVAQALNRHRSLVEGSQSLLDIVFRAGSCIQTVGYPGFDDRAQRGAGLHLIGCQAVNLGKPGVGDHNALLGIVQAQALRHVLEGSIETQVPRPQLFLALTQQPVLLFKAGAQVFAHRDVLMRADQAAIGHRSAQDRDRASVGQAHDLRYFIAKSGNTVVDEFLRIEMIV